MKKERDDVFRVQGYLQGNLELQKQLLLNRYFSFFSFFHFSSPKTWSMPLAKKRVFLSSLSGQIEPL